MVKRIVVDLTPVLPGGENGGAKTMTIELLRQLGLLHRECEFVLLTADASHDELDILDGPN
ncbi:MAG: glycosyltransferase family 4 protein, partial [Bacteroidota bacterium]